MTPSDSRPASAVFLTGIYTAFFLFGCVVFLAINHFFPSFDNSASGIIVMVVAATTMAQIWAFREKSRPAGKRAWVISLLCATVTTVLLVGAAILGGIGDFELLAELQQDGGATLLLILSVFVLALDLVIIRLSIWLGPKFKLI